MLNLATASCWSFGRWMSFDLLGVRPFHFVLSRRVLLQHNSGKRVDTTESFLMLMTDYDFHVRWDLPLAR